MVSPDQWQDELSVFSDAEFVAQRARLLLLTTDGMVSAVLMAQFEGHARPVVHQRELGAREVDTLAVAPWPAWQWPLQVDFHRERGSLGEPGFTLLRAWGFGGRFVRVTGQDRRPLVVAHANDRSRV